MFVNLDLGMKDKYVILLFIKITEIIFTNISADTVFGPSEGMDLVLASQCFKLTHGTLQLNMV